MPSGRFASGFATGPLNRLALNRVSLFFYARVKNFQKKFAFSDLVR